MLLRCLQANNSFEEEWAALSSQHLQTGLRRGGEPQRAGRSSVKWSCGNMEQSNYSVCAEDNTLPAETACCPSMFAKASLRRNFEKMLTFFRTCVHRSLPLLWRAFVSFSCPFPNWYFVLVVNVVLPVPSRPIFPQKLSIGLSVWTLRLSPRLFAGAPKRTCWGRLKVTRTSLLHFMTLLPAETTRSASPKVNTDVLS